MIVAFTILNILITLVPAFIILNTPMIDGYLSAALAVALAAVVLTLQKSEFDRALRALGGLTVIVLLAPALWMLLQLLPLRSDWLVNPVWVSASAAMGKPMPGSISVDIGATLLALGRYLLLLAAGLVTLAVTLNRQHANDVLAMVTAIATFVALSLIVIDFGYLGLLDIELTTEPDEALIIAIMGSITSCALAIGTSGYHDMRNRVQPEARLRKRLAIGALVVCLAAISIHETVIGLLAALFGIGVLASISVIRIWRFGPWGYAGVAAVAAVALIGFFALVPANRNTDLTLAWSGEQEIAATERMLSNSRWAGTGAGTAIAVAPFYRQADDAEAPAPPATAAATIAIEMGRPFLTAALIVLLAAAGWLFLCALRRGRDYIYAGAGAGCLVAFLLCLFMNSGVLGLAASLMTSVIFGLALAQGKGSHVGIEPSHTIRAALAATPSPASGFWGRELAHSIPLRGGLVVLCTTLALQAVWILPAELKRPTELTFPPDQKTALARRAAQVAAGQAAAMAMVRGDLWAESAFSHGEAMWPDPTAGASGGTPVRQAMEALARAVRYAPHRGDAWLMLAGLTTRYAPPSLQPALLLKMSYYTAPSSRTLVSARIAIASHVREIKDDDELQDMLKRDISIALSDRSTFKSALDAAYTGASPAGKAFIEDTIRQIDPTYVSIMRTGHR